MRKYRPRRATAKWLTNAPDCVLAVYDTPKYYDRYDVILGEEFMHTDDDGKTWILGFTLSEHGAWSMYSVPATDVQAFRNKFYHRMMRWDGLPERAKETVKERIVELRKELTSDE